MMVPAILQCNDLDWCTHNDICTSIERLRVLLDDKKCKTIISGMILVCLRVATFLSPHSPSIWRILPQLHETLA
jgi:hypothetical protein